jgi:uncharacterized protein YggE
MVREEFTMLAGMEHKIGRHLGAGALAAVLGIMLIGSVSAASQGAGGPAGGTSEIAQGITVSGSGEAEANVASAILQFIVRKDGSMNGKPDFVEGEAGPGTADGGAPPAVSDEDLAPLIAAVKSNGIDDKDIDTVTVPNGSFSSAFGPGTAVLVVQLDKASLRHRVKIANAVTNAGTGQGLTFDQVGVAYIVDDCAALDREAIAKAAQNAREQADLIAEVLGLTVGDIIGVQRQPSYGAYGGGSNTDACGNVPTMETATEQYFPGFNPDGEAKYEIYENLTVTYSLG